MKTDFEIAEELAAKYLNRQGLLVQNSDRLDFFEVGVWQVTQVIYAALDYRKNEAEKAKNAPEIYKFKEGATYANHANSFTILKRTKSTITTTNGNRFAIQLSIQQDRNRIFEYVQSSKLNKDRNINCIVEEYPKHWQIVTA